MVGGDEVALVDAPVVRQQARPQEVGEVAGGHLVARRLPVDDGQRVAAVGGAEHHVVEPVVAVGDRVGRPAQRHPALDAAAEPLPQLELLGRQVALVAGHERRPQHLVQGLEVGAVALLAAAEPLEVVEAGSAQRGAWSLASSSRTIRASTTEQPAI